MKSPLIKVSLKPEATDVMMQLSVSSSGGQRWTWSSVTVKLLLESLFPAEWNTALGANISLEEN